MRAFLLGTAIALALLAAAALAVTAARPVHAAAPASVVAAAPAAASKLQAAVSPADTSAEEAGWVQYGAFGVAMVVLLVIGTGMVPRRR